MGVKKYVNREISWLSFNERVLQEAEDKTVPILTRLKFLGIFSNNLDEFFRVRVATVKRVLSVGKKKIALGFDAKETFQQIQQMVIQQQRKFEAIYQATKEELTKHDIYIINEKEVTGEQGQQIKAYFREKVLPILVPLMISDIASLPDLKDGSIYLAVHLSKRDGSIKNRFALIEVPTDSVSRFFVLNSDNGKDYVMILDDVIRYCLEDVFAIFGYDDCHAYTVKLTKDAEIDIDDDVTKSFLEIIDSSIKQRKHGQPIRLIHDYNIKPDLLQFLKEELDLSESDHIIPGGRYHNFKDFMGFPSLGKKHLDNKKMPPLPHPLIGPNTNIFKVIDQGDFMLHYPYQSYMPVIMFVREAAIDPNVQFIKMTLYRVANRSSIINALINAKKNGKDVTVVLELQARFDEENNIKWAKVLQEHGINVIHGPKDIKIHAKLCLIGRQSEDGQFTRYVKIGTGNFNESTAKIYCDDSLFTEHRGITKEVVRLFDYMENQEKLDFPEFKHLLVSPYDLMPTIFDFINREIANAKEGKPAFITVKLNSLNDQEMIDKLYKASKAGVKIKLIIRGICCLIPGVKGLSENIEAISIVDKYLEHSRVYVFCNNNKIQYYISSADWMERNLRRRIEVGVPIYDKKLQKELQTILDYQFEDNVKARYLNNPAGNVYVRNDKKPKRAQNRIYDYFKRMLDKK